VLTQHGPHACIHCAGGASVDDSMRNPEADFLAGPVITFELLEAVRRLTPECLVVLLSSAAVYGNPDALPVSESQPPSPLSPYGFHKLQCEQLCTEYHRVYGTATAIARIFSAYGAGLRKQVLWDISRAALANERLLLRGTGNESRDFVHGRDVAAGLRAIAENGSRAAAVYNLASGEETTIRSLAALLLDAMGIQRRVGFDGIVPPGTPLNWRADIREIEGLGFAPRVTLAEGVTSFARWRLSEQGR
jgi:UDP-glucose 4-epimerase